MQVVVRLKREREHYEYWHVDLKDTRNTVMILLQLMLTYELMKTHKIHIHPHVLLVLWTYIVRMNTAPRLDLG